MVPLTRGLLRPPRGWSWVLLENDGGRPEGRPPLTTGELRGYSTCRRAAWLFLACAFELLPLLILMLIFFWNGWTPFGETEITRPFLTVLDFAFLILPTLQLALTSFF